MFRRFVDNVTTEYNKNTTLTKLVVVFIVLYIVGNVTFYKRNVTRAVKDRDANVGEYSPSSKYVNISPMKHDMFKQFTTDVIPIILVFGLPSLFYYITSSNKNTIIRFDDIIAFDTYTHFMNSILGRTILSIMGYFIFYQLIEPTFVNRIPYF